MKDKSILAVDDESELLKMLQSVFERAGYTKITTASSGKEALAIFRENQPDMVILDVMMPGIDGFTVLKEIRKTSTIPVLMLTARGEADDKFLGFENGADDYLIKPFLPKELLLRVQAILNRAYPEKERIVYLEGEAYFEVAKQKNKPFIVKTKEQDIEALGTKFNVMAYPMDSMTITTLLEGSVRLTTMHIAKQTILESNQQFVYNRNTESAILRKVDARQFVSWTSGYYYFHEQSLKAILDRLSHVYGVEFAVSSKTLNKRTFTGTFYRGQSIKDIMEIINLSIPVKYKIDDHHVTISER